MAKVEFTVKDIPRKKPGEEPATQKQLEYLRQLAPFKESDLKNLGKWQASYLIDQAKEIRDRISHGKLRRKKQGCGCLSIVVLVLAIGVLVKLGQDSHSDSTDKKPTSKAQESHKQVPLEQPTLPKSDLVTTFENINLPVAVITTKEFDLLNEVGKETTIPVGSVIMVEKRGDKGALTMHVKGALFVGNELRLSGKVKLR